MARVCWVLLLLPMLVGFLSSAEVPPEEQTENILSEASCNFGLELLKAASAKDDENVLVSPISVSMILSMLQQGAQSNTAEQLQNVLHTSSEVSKEAYTTIISGLKDDKKKVTLEWGNGVYLKDGFDLEEDFKNIVKNNFQSNIEQVNFTVPENVASTINNWIGEVTHGEILNLINPYKAIGVRECFYSEKGQCMSIPVRMDSSIHHSKFISKTVITKEALMVLVNAIYFKGIWASKFERIRTRLDIFKRSEEETINTFFMRQDERFPAGEDANLGLKWLELPYEDERFSMLLILPNSEQGLKQVVDNMSGADLKRLISNTYTRHVFVTIPKFKLSWKSSLQIPLQKLGLTDLFNTNADLGGISSTHKALRVSEMIHQANIEVDEDGTTAAAAVFAFGEPLSLSIYPDGMVFYADHPFLLFIIDKKYKIPLFAAKINNPLYE